MSTFGGEFGRDGAPFRLVGVLEPHHIGQQEPATVADTPERNPTLVQELDEIGP
jgi:hypothetical protein